MHERPMTHERTDATTAERRTRAVSTVAIAASGAVMVVLVAHDGSAGWQVLRALVVAGVTVVALVAAGSARRLPARLAGVVEVGLGLVVFSTGVGIAVPHLSKLGADPIGIVGSIGVLAGLSLLIVGGVDLLRSTPIWVRVLTIPALVVVTVLALWTIGQAVAATNVPATSVDDDRRTELTDEQAVEDVELTTSDAVRLSGWYVPSSNGAAVALLHGAGSTRTGVLRHARLLAQHGYGVLVFDARGHGDSGGRAMDFGWYGDEDAEAAVSFLSAQPDVDAGRIALVGLSMGGEEAIGAAAADERVQAVVADGATNRRAADKAWLDEQHGWRGRIQQAIDAAMYGVTDALTEADPPTPLADAVVAAAPRPVLLIAAGAMPDEVASNEWLRSRAPTSVEVWVAPDSGHIGAQRAHPEEYERRVIDFLDRALAAPPA